MFFSHKRGDVTDAGINNWGLEFGPKTIIA